MNNPIRTARGGSLAIGSSLPQRLRGPRPPTRRWRLNPDGTVVGVESGLCPEVTGAGTANGTAVEMWT